jgi:uncharacterized protein (DUF983 family)
MVSFFMPPRGSSSWQANRASAGRGVLAALWRGRCPDCREGRIFRGRVTMHRRCPVCDLDFEPEPGYFTGAMYISYALAVPLVALLAMLVRLALPQLGAGTVILVAAVFFVPAVPGVFRASRVLWIHLGRALDRY